MRFDASLQELALALLAHDAEGGRAIRSRIEADDFDAVFRTIAEELFRYWDSYAAPPGEHTSDLFQTARGKKPREADALTVLQNSVAETWASGVNRAFVVEKIGLFWKRQKIRSQIGEALEALDREDEAGTDEAETALLKVRDIGSKTDLASRILLSDPASVLRALEKNDQEETDYLPCGIAALDANRASVHRRQLHVLLGLAGHGKSWWLVHLLKQAILHRWKVLALSCELDETEWTKRVVQSLFAIGKRRDAFRVTRIEKEKDGSRIVLRPEMLRPEYELGKSETRTFIANQLKHFGPRLKVVVRGYPMGTLTLKGIETELDLLLHESGFVPDLVIVDYPGIMQHPVEDLRHSLRSTYVGLRGIGQRRNLAMAVVAQSNRAGSDARWLRGKHIGEDFAIFQNADVLMTLNRTSFEKTAGLARLWVEKNRTDVDNYAVLINQALATGQFALDGVPFPTEYWSLVDPKGDVAGEEAKEAEEEKKPARRRRD